MTNEEKQIILEHQQGAPVDITALATALGVSVYESFTLPEGVSGKIARAPRTESPSGYTITVKITDPYRRRRFTIAHECAHFLLHRAKFGDELSDDAMYRSEKLTSQDEFDANNLAAELLMPRKLVDAYVREGKAGSESLSKIFNVSEAAMKVRLRYLYWQDRS